MSSQINEQTPFVLKNSDQLRQLILFDIARRYKGVDPIIDARIDAAASEIAGAENVTFIPPVVPGAPVVPFYLEGEPGVGKTSLIRSAIKRFCEIAGLRLVENPESNDDISDDCFYFATVNLSGKQNTSDFGGMPYRRKLEEKSISEGFEESLKAISSFAKASVKEAKRYQEGSNNVLEVVLAGDADTCVQVVDAALQAKNDSLKAQGLAVIKNVATSTMPTDSYACRIEKGKGGIRITFSEPKHLTNEEQFVTSMLPNVRFQLARKARFCFFNFDDVANANMAVRNVLLEVAQFGKYSGVMDLNGAMMSFTGNIGAEDNTNTMSQQSDAEVTRVRKYRVMDTPEDWARRMFEKYGNQPGGDAHFGTFILLHGKTRGIFRPEKDNRGKKGTPKSNSRSLENALACVQPIMYMAEKSEINPMIFSNIIDDTVAATCGKPVAMAYSAHLKAMMTEAYPMARDLMFEDKIDRDLFDEKTGMFVSPQQTDFGFRFAAAAADCFVQYLDRKFTEDEKRNIPAEESIKAHVKEAARRLTRGVASLQPTMFAFAVSRLNSRLQSIPALMQTSKAGDISVKSDVYMEIAAGFSEASLNPNEALWETQSQYDTAKDQLGWMLSGSKKTPKAKH